MPAALSRDEPRLGGNGHLIFLLLEILEMERAEDNRDLKNNRKPRFR